MQPVEQLGPYGPYGLSEDKDPSRGPKLFQAAIAKYQAVTNSKKVEQDAAADVISRLNTEMPEETGTSRLNMEPLNLHPDLFEENNGEGSNGESEGTSPKNCPSKCTCILL